jgi:hypothetical protein
MEIHDDGLSALEHLRIPFSGGSDIDLVVIHLKNKILIILLQIGKSWN